MKKKPRLNGLATHGGGGRGEVEGFPGEPRGEEVEKGHGVTPEGVAPAQGVEERGHAEGKDEDDEETPRQIPEGLHHGTGADADHEPHEERRPREEEAEPEQPHQVGGSSARRARDSMRSIRTNGTSSHTAAVVMVEMRTRVV